MWCVWGFGCVGVCGGWWFVWVCWGGCGVLCFCCLFVFGFLFCGGCLGLVGGVGSVLVCCVVVGLLCGWFVLGRCCWFVCRLVLCLCGVFFCVGGCWGVCGVVCCFFVCGFGCCGGVGFGWGGWFLWLGCCCGFLFLGLFCFFFFFWCGVWGFVAFLGFSLLVGCLVGGCC
ncbi:hypothetical protein, partial [Pseudomonas syringae group genomosp. 7]|uniref:hypothetical protein n=1 Tax=Pseudomonas syringae group genomosp. 7 TaxID=251699 RepID=UPI0037704805